MEATIVPEIEVRTRTRANQYIASLVVSILSLSQGSFNGWPSPALPRLQSQDTPAALPPIGDEEASWVGSIGNLSSIVAIPLYSYSVDKLGRKRAGYLTALPFIVGWALTMCANSVTLLYAARLIGGLSAGGAGVIVTTYTNDVADDDIRGRLGIFYAVSLSMGMLISYMAGSYLTYTWFNVVCLLQPVAFVVGFFWLPEAPLYLVTKGKDQEAKESLKWFSGGGDAEKDFYRTKMRAEEFERKKQTKVALTDVMNRSTGRALLICLGLMANMQISGLAPVLTYGVTIFSDTGSSLPANTSIIVMVSVKTVGTILSSAVVERSGRRLLLISANIVSAASHLLLGGFFYLKHRDMDVDFIQWLPLTCLSIFVLCAGLALLSVPYLMTTELPSPQARGLVQSVSITFVSAAIFATTKTFTAMSILVGNYGCFWFYGSACLFCAIVVYLTVPETKGRSSEEIVAQLGSDHYISSIVAPGRKDNVENKTMIVVYESIALGSSMSEQL